MIEIYHLLIKFTDEKQLSLYDFELFWGGGAELIDEGYIVGKCLKCGTPQNLYFTDVQAVSSQEREMGPEIMYTGQVYEKCCKCGYGDEDGEIEFYEYPKGVMNFSQYSSQYFTTNLLFSEYVSCVFLEFEKLSEESQGILKKQIIQSLKPFENLEQKSQAINELKELLSNRDISESDLQRFFEKKENWWMFGPEYVEAIPQVQSNGNKPDFLLKRYDDFHDLVELEKPYPTLFVKRGKDLDPRNELTHGVSQINRYYEQFFKNDDFRRKGRRIYRPKRILIIGRTNNSEVDRLRRFRDDNRQIDLWTYDDIVERSKQIIRFVIR